MLLALATVVAGGIMPCAASASASDGFSVRPAHSDPADAATRAYFKMMIGPGGSSVDQVLVGNAGNEPVRLIVSSVDGLTGETSGAVYANRQDPVAKAGAWVTPSVTTVTVAPHGETRVGFVARVPVGAAPGDHLAGIAFENAAPRATSGDRFSVTQVLRAVVGVLIQVPGPSEFRPHAVTAGLAALPGVGSAAVMINLRNDGAKLGKPRVEVALDGPAAYHRTISRQLDTLLPGDSIEFPLPWPDTLHAGDYDLVATVTGGREPAVLHTHVHLGPTLPGPLVAKHRVARAQGVPVWLLLLATGLGGGMLGALIVRRPRRQ